MKIRKVIRDFINRIFGRNKQVFIPNYESLIYQWPDLPSEKASDAIIELSPDSKNKYCHFTAKKIDVHDLKKIVGDIDKVYFNSFFIKEHFLPRISWWWRGAKNDSNYAICGLAFINFNEILINVRFKSKNAPPEIIEYLIYHEMLHIYLYANGRPHGHNRVFYKLESNFKNYDEVRESFEKFCKSNVTGVPLSATRFKKPSRIFTCKRFKVPIPIFSDSPSI